MLMGIYRHKDRIYRFGQLLISSLIPLCLSGTVLAASLEEVQKIGENKLLEAEQSQQRIDKIVEGAQERLIQYRSLMKQIDGLQAYNEQLSNQVTVQESLIQRFEKSIAQVALIERQIAPLLAKMTDSLDKFVELDLPFHLVERKERLAYIRDNLASADIDAAEKFRRVIEAYQIENEYGRTIDSYQDIVMINGIEWEVDVLRVGRIAMVCQSKDTKISAHWNNESRDWQVLNNVTYRNALRNGIRMAKKQAPIHLLTLPIAAPEVAE